LKASLEQLLRATRNAALSPEEKEKQRRSFAYGNIAIENPRVTREMIDQEAEALAALKNE
jgi:hypothetical protein